MRYSWLFLTFSSSLTLLCSSLPWRPMGSRTQASELPSLSCAFRVTTVLDVWTSIFLRSWMWERVLSPPKERRQTRKVWCILLRIKTPPLPNSRIELIWFAHQHEENGDLTMRRSECPKGKTARWRGLPLGFCKTQEGRRQKAASSFQSQLQLAFVSPSWGPSQSLQQTKGL